MHNANVFCIPHLQRVFTRVLRLPRNLLDLAKVLCLQRNLYLTLQSAAPTTQLKPCKTFARPCQWARLRTRSETVPRPFRDRRRTGVAAKVFCFAHSRFSKPWFLCNHHLASPASPTIMIMSHKHHNRASSASPKVRMIMTAQPLLLRLDAIFSRQSLRLDAAPGSYRPLVSLYLPVSTFRCHLGIGVTSGI